MRAGKAYRLTPPMPPQPLIMGTTPVVGAPNNNSVISIGGIAQSSNVSGSSSYNYQTPTTGFSLTLGNSDIEIILDPAGTLASGTITMCPVPADGQFVEIKTSQLITALTVLPNAGQSVKGDPSTPITLVPGIGVRAIYRAANTTWYF